MTEKKILIKAVMDNTEFDTQIQKLEQKLRQLQQSQKTFSQAQQSYSPQSKMGEHTRAFFGDYNQDNVDKLREMFNLNARKLQHESKELLSRGSELKKLEKIEDNLNVIQKARITLLKEEIDTIKKRGQEIVQQNTMISQQAKSLGSGLEGFKGVGGGQEDDDSTGLIYTQRMRNYKALRQKGLGVGLSRGLSALGGLAGAGGLAMAAGQVGLSGWTEFAEKQRNLAMAQGSATSMATVSLQEQAQGRGVENLIFSKERQRGLEVAGNEMSSQRLRDIAGIAMPTWGKIGAGVAGFAAAGPIGAAVGYAGAAMTDKRSRGALLGTEEYQSTLTKEGLEKARSVEAAEKLKNFQRTMAYDEFGRSGNQYRQFQQMFGQENATNPEGMLGQINRAGMTRSTGMELGGQLMQASGITTGSGDLNNLKQMQLLKEGGITNIGQVAGRIKGLESGFGEKSQEKVLEKIMYDAMKAGINDSKMVEETRNFLNITTQLATQKGVSAGGISEEIARGTMTPSGVGLQSAMTAFQMREQESGDLGGARGAFKWAYSGTEEGQKSLGGMSNNFELTSSFLGMPISQMTEDNPMVQRFMKETGAKDINELKDIKRKFELRGSTPRGETLQKLEQFGKSIEGMSGQDITKAVSGGGLNDLYTNITGALSTERGSEFRGLNFRDQMSYVTAMSRGDMTGGQQSTLGDIAARGGKSPYLAGEKAEAADQLSQMNRLNKFIDEFADISNKYSESTKMLLNSSSDVDESMKLFQKAIENGASSLEMLQGIMVSIKRTADTGSIDESWKRGNLQSQIIDLGKDSAMKSNKGKW
ncbi:MAG TPA: hypothetical protein VI911_12235 [Patescibacteria group bacterium]|nr:hypothetical protein [Patescibacteria group bacterium]